jgi:nuclear receptor subfamily 4 group A protein 2
MKTRIVGFGEFAQFHRFFFFFFSERHGLSDPKKVENLQNKVINSLKDHVTYNPDAQRKGQQYFSRILDRLPTLRSLSVQGLQRIFYLKLEDLVPAPPLIEKMFASSIPF